MVKTNCLCSDSTKLSLYDISDAKDNILADQNCCEKDLPSEDNSRENHSADCGCDSPTVTYIKLNSHHGSDTNLEYPSGKIIGLVEKAEVIILTLEHPSVTEETYPYYLPPEKPYGRILISFLNQRKIALSA